VLGEQSAKTRENPSLALDPAWRAQTTTTLELLTAAGQEMQAYEPVPPAARTLNDTIVSLAVDLVDVADEYSAAIDAGSPERIAIAATRTRSMLAKTAQATSQLRQIEPR